MASSSSGAAAAMGDSKPSPTAQELQDALYAKCAQEGLDRLWSQQDLLALGVIAPNDVETLLATVQQLTNDGLFKSYHQADGAMAWKVVGQNDAKKWVYGVF
jgi:DNA-directed RNA polymerase III subunit RPC6